LKRTVQRPWGRKKAKGWIIQNAELIKALKMGDAVEFGNTTTGTAQLCQLLRLMPYPDSLIRANGRLEVETVQRFFSPQGADYKARVSFRKPRHNYSFFALVNKAWLPRESKALVVLKPRKY
jgi:hypothetical protein